jgi:CheY-like chemotaxis protein
MTVATRPDTSAPEHEQARLKVMIVDDDPDVRTVLEMLMDNEGFEVVGVAHNGADAVGIALDAQPDVVILDYMMPKIDGGESARFIRAVSPNTRIVAFSGVIHEKPEWADMFIEKGDIAEMGRLIGAPEPT